MNQLFRNAIKAIPFCLQNSNVMFQQVRSRWADNRMIRDFKRRQCVVQYADERLRLRTLLKNKILPEAIREDARAKIMELPRNSHYLRTTYRCALTSRGRGNVWPFRLSRIVWRDIADHNRISGVQRAMW
ncbi:small ribosomal subunit protein uS14m [Neocloeon triangulifer]|uniref:small ribosomal subunit protein uS14m n=1 Tax=Neocloeon triangulifer TaxID=2078957 RepID=UPI00286F471A|nr:small ribosomal subunit protein uS14m [Neocloeon triangulifer]